MQCADAEILLSVVRDGNRDESSARELRAHLNVCRNCRDVLANLLLVKAMCRIARGQWGKTETCKVSET